MRRINRRKISFNVEKQVLTGLIVSNKVINSVGTILSPGLFDLEVSKTVAGWVKNYYDQYKKAPGKAIQSIYHVNQDQLEQDVAEDIGQFLKSLSNEFVSNPPNEAYLTDVTKDYLRTQNYVKSAEEVIKLREAGASIADIEQRLLKRDQVNKLTRKSQFINLFDPLFINRMFTKEETEKALFLADPLHSYLGPIRPSWLISVLGPPKRGKTHHLVFFSLQGIRQRLRVVFVSLEMTDIQIGSLFYRGMGSLGSDEDEDVYDFTVIDCLHNQDNQCSLKKRTCQVGMNDKGYNPCTVCAGTKGFKPAFVQFKESRPGLNYKEVKKVRDGASLHYGEDNLRVIAYPPFSVSLSDIVADIDSLAVEENFHPDMIVIDYADVLLPNRARRDELVETDETWMAMKQLAAVRHCIVFTATQGNRGSTERSTLEEKDIGGFYRKLAHVDITLSINQDSYEKDMGVERLGIIGHRHKKFNKMRTLMLTNQFEVGQLGLTGVQILEEKKSKKK